MGRQAVISLFEDEGYTLHNLEHRNVVAMISLRHKKGDISECIKKLNRFMYSAGELFRTKTPTAKRKSPKTPTRKAPGPSKAYMCRKNK